MKNAFVSAALIGSLFATPVFGQVSVNTNGTVLTLSQAYEVCDQKKDCVLDLIKTRTIAIIDDNVLDAAVLTTQSRGPTIDIPTTPEGRFGPAVTTYYTDYTSCTVQEMPPVVYSDPDRALKQ